MTQGEVSSSFNFMAQNPMVQVAGHPTDLHIRRRKVQFGKLRSPLGIGKPQRYSSSTAITRHPWEKDRPYFLGKLVLGSFGLLNEQ